MTLPAWQYVTLYSVRHKEYSVVVACKDAADARDIFVRWARETHNARILESDIPTYRINRTTAIGGRPLITYAREES